MKEAVTCIKCAKDEWPGGARGSLGTIVVSRGSIFGETLPGSLSLAGREGEGDAGSKLMGVH